MNHFGIHTRSELVEAGIPPSTVTSRYRRVLPRVYATREPTTLALCYAITRWQPSAVLSHRAAAWLHGWIDEPKILDATVPPGLRVRAPGWIRIHRRRLDPRHVTEAWSLPVVSATQTLVDCAAVLPPEEYEPLVDARLATSVDPEQLQALCAANPGRWGNTAATTQLRLAAVHAASEPERLLARSLNRQRCPMAANERIGPYVCDFVDRHARLVVEVDGREFHSAPEVFRSDRKRQNWLVRQGWLVLRYAAYDVLADPDAIAAEIIAVVRQRRHSRRPPA